MKKLLVFLIVVGAAVFLVQRFVLTSATERSCQRLASLCGDKSMAVDSCVRGMNDLAKNDKEAARKFDSCVGDAKSCAAGAGCLVGAGLSAAGGLLNEFMKGIGDAVKK
jgi:hypothetical protein